MSFMKLFLAQPRFAMSLQHFGKLQYNPLIYLSSKSRKSVVVQQGHNVYTISLLCIAPAATFTIY